MNIFRSPRAFRAYLLPIIVMSFCLLSLAFVHKTDVKKQEMVVLTTEFGDMTIRLYDETPLHKENFLKLVKEGFYDDLLFHRVIQGFMVQGGDPDSKNAPEKKALGTGGPGYTVPAEFNPNLFHKKGALAAARQGDAVNPEKASSGSQFYIVQGKPVAEKDLLRVQRSKQQKSGNFDFEYSEEQIATYSTLGGTPHLDMDYTVFGEVILDSIKESMSGTNAYSCQQQNQA